MYPAMQHSVPCMVLAWGQPAFFQINPKTCTSFCIGEGTLLTGILSCYHVLVDKSPAVQMQSTVYHLVQKLDDGSGLFPFPLQMQMVSLPWLYCLWGPKQYLIPTQYGSTSLLLQVFFRQYLTVLHRARVSCQNSFVYLAIHLSLCFSFLCINCAVQSLYAPTLNFNYQDIISVF